VYKVPARRGTKRRANCGEYSDTDGDDDGDEDYIDATFIINYEQTNTLLVNDIPALKQFYYVRFQELTMKPLRQIVTAWVKELSPERTKHYGPYNSKSAAANRANKNVDKSKRPPWWPKNLPYQEPSHLQRKGTIPICFLDFFLLTRIQILFHWPSTSCSCIVR
jgi:hypothetical protein